MLMLSRIRDHLGHLGLCDFISKDPTDSFALGMDLQHNSGCFRAVHREETLQDIDDEFHGSVIVVDQDHLVQRRTLQLRRRFLDDQACSFPPTLDVSHESLVYRARPRGLQDVRPKPPWAATVAKWCQFTLTSKNKCLSGLADSPYDSRSR